MVRLLYWLFILNAFFCLSSCAATTASSDPYSKKASSLSIAEQADEILNHLASSNFEALSAYVHPTEGLNFSPYYRDLTELSILNFTRADVAKFPADSTKYNWGKYDGSGFPIQLTPMAYIREFVYDIDYQNKANKEVIAFSQFSEMDSFGSLAKAYPNSKIVRYFFEGTEKIGFINFRELILVFTQIEGKWWLVGMAHGESTV